MPSKKIDMTAGWMAGMDRKIRKEEAVEKALKEVIQLAYLDSKLDENDQYINEKAVMLIEELKKIDRS